MYNPTQKRRAHFIFHWSRYCMLRNTKTIITSLPVSWFFPTPYWMTFKATLPFTATTSPYYILAYSTLTLLSTFINISVIFFIFCGKEYIFYSQLYNKILIIYLNSTILHFTKHKSIIIIQFIFSFTEMTIISSTDYIVNDFSKS